MDAIVLEHGSLQQDDKMPQKEHGYSLTETWELRAFLSDRDKMVVSVSVISLPTLFVCTQGTGMR